MRIVHGVGSSTGATVIVGNYLTATIHHISVSLMVTALLVPCVQGDHIISLGKGVVVDISV